MRRFLFFISVFPLFFVSCIKDPAPNAEADILTFDFPADGLRSATVITNNDVIVFPKADAELIDSAYVLTVTEGATYTVSKVDEDNILYYFDVTSQDQKSTKRYTVRQVVAFPSIFEFNEWVKVDPNKQFENPKDGDIQWSSGNAGYGIINSTKPANEYPVRKTIDSYSGTYAAELVTLLGPSMNPCVAGSVFLGNFDASKALFDRLKTTQFGIPFSEGKPIKFKGYYKYKEGTNGFTYWCGNTTCIDPDRRDSCDIYAILFKPDANTPYLYGDNVKDSPNIIAKAQIKDRWNTPETTTNRNNFVSFEVDFDYSSYTTPFSMDELRSNQYKIAIVCTSSTRGAYAEGRIGSRLVVDALQIIWE